MVAGPYIWHVKDEVRPNRFHLGALIIDFDDDIKISGASTYQRGRSESLEVTILHEQDKSESSRGHNDCELIYLHPHPA